MSTDRYDVAIIGGGPGGLAAALALGRARKRVLVCDSGPRRNAAATHIHNFVTRDGTPPDEFRGIAREQLGRYKTVDVRDVGITAITGTRGAFELGPFKARRILLATGMIDEMPAIDGFRELWGHSIFQCPYCHGFENADRAWGYLILPTSVAHAVPFAIQARGWSREVTVFTNGLVIPDDARARLEAARIPLHGGSIARLVGRDGQISAVELSDGTSVRCDALFAHPAQRQVDLVRSLGLELDEDGYVKADPMKRETSIPGIYAAGDLTTRGQGAILAAAAGTHAAAAINVDVTFDLVAEGLL